MWCLNLMIENLGALETTSVATCPNGHGPGSKQVGTKPDQLIIINKAL